MVDAGAYRTEAGSTATVGPRGSFTGYFDWLEEPNACIKCRFVDVRGDGGDVVFQWDCDYCSGGFAVAHREPPP